MVRPIRGKYGADSDGRRRFFREAAILRSVRCSAPENENIVSKSRPCMLLASIESMRCATLDERREEEIARWKHLLAICQQICNEVRKVNEINMLR